MIRKPRLSLAVNRPKLLQIESLGVPVKAPSTGTIDYRYDVLAEGVQSYWYAEPAAHQLIEQMRTQIGDWIEVVAYSDGRYSVRRTSDASEPGASIPKLAPVSAPVPGSNAIRRTNDAPPAYTNGNGNGHANGRATAAIATEAEQPYSRVDIMRACLCDAYDAVRGVEQYADSKGDPFRVDAEQVARIGITLYINYMDGGAR